MNTKDLPLVRVVDWRFGYVSTKSSRIADNTSNDTATILRDLNSFRTPPAATSTPQVSLRMSGSSQYPFHSSALTP